MKDFFLWVLRFLVAAILLQTLYFKFTGAEESVEIFSTLFGRELESFVRIGSGIAELIAAILIMIPRFTGYGAVLAMGIMAGAIFSHLFTSLGIAVKGDGGLLFGLAVFVFVGSAILAWHYRRSLPIIGHYFA